MLKNQSVSIFISYNSKDKNFAKDFTLRLMLSGARVWIDKAEIKIGESLIQKISSAIHSVDYVLALISKHSVRSSWVKKELEIAMSMEIKKKKVIVIPIRLDNCKFPSFLKDKKWADFRPGASHDKEFEKLLWSLGISRSFIPGIRRERLHRVPLKVIIPSILEPLEITKHDCGTTLSMWMTDIYDEEGFVLQKRIERALGRVPIEDIKTEHGVIFKKNKIITLTEFLKIEDKFAIYSLGELRIRTIWNCKCIKSSAAGVCALCFGGDPLNGELVKVGDKIGLRFADLFLSSVAALKDKSSILRILDPYKSERSIISEKFGTIRLKPAKNKGYHLCIIGDNGDKYELYTRNDLWVKDRDRVWFGQRLTKGRMDFSTILGFYGENYLANYMITNLERSFRSDKIIVDPRVFECIIALMTSFVSIISPGDTGRKKGEILPQWKFVNINDQIIRKGKRPTTGQQEALTLTELYNRKKNIVGVPKSQT